MKIAILTLPIGPNYGGILQAWAMQQVLKRMGHQPVTIDRQANARGFLYESVRLAYRLAMKSTGKRKEPVLIDRHTSLVTTNMRKFIQERIVMSQPLRSTEALRQHFLSEGYEAILVGSDQTWRPQYSPNIYNYFLDFLVDQKVRKIAYASSFGVDAWEFSPQQTSKCSALAKKFDLVSVRESSGIELCRKYLDVGACSALDPTLLLDADDYLPLLTKEINSSGSNGVYTYFLDPSVEKERLAERVAAELGVRVLTHLASADRHNKSDHKDRAYVLPSVEEWLSGFMKARFVVTDSFHGMVFSIIFNKPFVVLRNMDRGNARFMSLLSSLNLTHRLVECHLPDLEDLTSSPITKENRPLIDDLKGQSVSFLSKIALCQAA